MSSKYGDHFPITNVKVEDGIVTEHSIESLLRSNVLLRAENEQLKHDLRTVKQERAMLELEIGRLGGS